MSVFDRPIVMLDFETTGLSPESGDRITEVAALRIADGEVIDRFVSLVNCGVRVPPFITSLTGITQQMVDDAPPAAEVVPHLIDFIGSNTIAAHNASFDEKFLKAEGARLGKGSRHEGVVCSVKLSRRVFPGLPSYRLGELARWLGINNHRRAHRAEGDAEVAAQLLLHIGRHLNTFYGLKRVEPSLLVTVNASAAGRVHELLRSVQYSEMPSILGIDGRPYDEHSASNRLEICTYLEDKLFDAVSRNPELMYAISSYEFEQLIAELLHRQGYQIEMTPRSRDGGFDMYATKSDELGTLLFLVECKRYSKDNPVGVEIVRALCGNVYAKRATAGVIVTSSTFTKGAKEFQKDMHNQLALRDYARVRSWIEKKPSTPNFTISGKDGFA